MTDYQYKDKHLRTPVENNCTAAWADANERKSDSNVNLPDEFQIMNAKEHVDENQK